MRHALFLMRPAFISLFVVSCALLTFNGCSSEDDTQIVSSDTGAGDGTSGTSGSDTTASTSGTSTTDTGSTSGTSDDSSGGDTSGSCPDYSAITLPRDACKPATAQNSIDDFEDGDGNIIANECRNGSWEVFGDAVSVETGNLAPALGPITAATGTDGADGSTKSLTFSGALIDQYAGLAVNLVGINGACLEPGIPFDATGLTGVRFYARGNLAGADLPFQFKLNDQYTHAAGGHCTDKCYDAFTAYKTATADWTLFEIPFTEPLQEKWGDASPNLNVDPATIISINFQVGGTSGAAFELAIDQLAFY